MVPQIFGDHLGHHLASFVFHDPWLSHIGLDGWRHVIGLLPVMDGVVPWRRCIPLGASLETRLSAGVPWSRGRPPWLSQSGSWSGDWWFDAWLLPWPIFEPSVSRHLPNRGLPPEHRGPSSSTRIWWRIIHFVVSIEVFIPVLAMTPYLRGLALPPSVGCWRSWLTDPSSVQLPYHYGLQLVHYSSCCSCGYFFRNLGYFPATRIRVGLSQPDGSRVVNDGWVGFKVYPLSSFPWGELGVRPIPRELWGFGEVVFWVAESHWYGRKVFAQRSFGFSDWRAKWRVTQCTC